MKSIKPGRGPSGMNFAGSIGAVIFGVIWTVIAFGMTSNFPAEMGIVRIFPLFGVVFIAIGVVQAIYHYKNFTGKNRMSMLDITDDREEPDPLNEYFSGRQEEEPLPRRTENRQGEKYCPYCGQPMAQEFQFCPKCGKEYRE